MRPHSRRQLFLPYERCSPTMKTISLRIFGSLPGAAETIFSTDSYVDRFHSPKSAERDRRGCGEKFIVEVLNIRRPVDWKAFLTNDENKKSFIHLLLEHWSSCLRWKRLFEGQSSSSQGSSVQASLPWWSDIGGTSTRDLLRP